MKRNILILSIALMVLFGTLAAFAQVQPARTINCTGILRDTTTALVSDGYHTINITLFQSQYGGVPVCSSIRRVEVKDGRFHVQVKVPPTFSYNEAYYMSVAVVGSEDLAVRTELGSPKGGSSFTVGQDPASVQESETREIAEAPASTK